MNRLESKLGLSPPDRVGLEGKKMPDMTVQERLRRPRTPKGPRKG